MMEAIIISIVAAAVVALLCPTLTMKALHLISFISAAPVGIVSYLIGYIIGSIAINFKSGYYADTDFEDDAPEV